MSKFANRCSYLSRHRAAQLLGSLLLVAALQVQARSDASDAEMKLLPSYCPDTQGFSGYGDAYSNTSPRANHWISLMGPDFWHMHHYCYALLSVNRARKAQLSADQRQQLWNFARDNLQYVIDKASADFVMLPEVYTRLGDVELLRGQPDRAFKAFDRAREIKPDYWPAYSHWSEFLIRIGKRAEAMHAVTTGLKYAPNTKALLEQYRLLGGDLNNLPTPATPPSDERPAVTASSPDNQ